MNFLSVIIDLVLDWDSIDRTFLIRDIAVILYIANKQKKE